jgi:hypothetical protein
MVTRASARANPAFVLGERIERRPYDLPETLVQS